MAIPHGALRLLTFPYQEFTPYAPDDADRAMSGRLPGSGLVWDLSVSRSPAVRRAVRERPGGLALIVLLPELDGVQHDAGIWELVAQTRPHAILPHMSEPEVEDLTHMLRKPPEELPVAVTDYLRWRGVRIDLETVRLIRRTIQLSAELSSVTALSRAVYLSRRALGRRFSSRGLPVPSHWLQVGRILRLTLRLQNTQSSVFSVACDLGFPDGFSASNQMLRLLGHRPSFVRTHLGWEWVFEAWLRREAAAGCFRPDGQPLLPSGPATSGDAAARPESTRRALHTRDVEGGRAAG